jgi:RNA polymerase sigma-70 factor (ECF subfamily)
MMTNSPVDSALIEKARNDSEAFAELYRYYLTQVYRYLYRRIGNVHDTEDITAQVFTETLEGLAANRYRAGSCFSAWLFTIARHRLVDFYRKQPSLPLDEIQSTEPGLLSILEKADDHNRLIKLLSQLDEEKQELLRLRFSARLSFAEIALIENRSEAAVKMMLYRALDWLREHWEANNG